MVFSACCWFYEGFRKRFYDVIVGVYPVFMSFFLNCSEISRILCYLCVSSPLSTMNEACIYSDMIEIFEGGNLIVWEGFLSVENLVLIYCFIAFYCRFMFLLFSYKFWTIVGSISIGHQLVFFVVLVVTSWTGFVQVLMATSWKMDWDKAWEAK
ncbi:hypothetical protein RYX36_023829 [Vicia faba]